ncbi:hypothetical protein ARSEF1564_009471 [Beauveria bassiana]
MVPAHLAREARPGLRPFIPPLAHPSDQTPSTSASPSIALTFCCSPFRTPPSGAASHGPPGLTALTVARPRQLAAPAARVMASSAALGARVHGLALCSPIDDDTLDTLTVRPDQSRGR